MIEDFVQHIWTTLFRSISLSSSGMVFGRLIGSLWVGFFLAVTTPWWIYPLLRRENSFALPYSPAEAIGMNNVVGMIGIGAFILKTQFDAKI